jgi:GntR family transcriptional regulator
VTARTLTIDQASATPIWRQIEEGIARLVAGGALVAGSAVPSVRELARELRINPATVAKAYRRLVDARLLTVRRGEGTFVAAAPPPMAGSERQRLLAEAASRLAVVGLTLGGNLDEAESALRRAWRELEAGSKGVRR